MDKVISRKTFLPIVQVAFCVSGGAVMFQNPILGIAFYQVFEGVNLIVLLKFIPASFDLLFGIISPVFSFLLAGKMIANGRVAFDADNRTPYGGAVFVFAFIY